jgi:hypothetical protein
MSLENEMSHAWMDMDVKSLDPTLDVFEACGQWQFPVYGQSGGITTIRCFYLMRRVDSRVCRVLGIQMDNEPNLLHRAVAAFDTQSIQVDDSHRDMGFPVKV